MLEQLDKKLRSFSALNFIPKMASAKDASENSSFENQVLGTVYGNCIGDAVGLLTEFMSKREADKVCKPCIHVYM